jgi:hypothetical protein
MDINTAFPSKYLKASDLMGRNAKVVIGRVEVEMIGQDRRAILYFQGKEKGLVLNKTNANSIQDIWGPNTDVWEGKEITLYPTRVDYQGKRVDAIRVQVTPPVRQQPAPAQQAQYNDRNPPPANRPVDHDNDMDDSIPF